MSYIQQLLKGLVDPIVLSLINQLPMYGYQIAKELEQRTGGRLILKGGTIYPALTRLQRNGLVVSTWHKTSKRKGRRYYQITERGRQFLASCLSDWQDFYKVINKLTQEAYS